jgi:D-inositol-3-phosphate glycosyltransferase
LPNFDCYTDAGNFDRKVEREKLGYEERDLVLLFFGYVRKYKGLDILIQSFKKIHDRNKNARLLIVGEFYQDPTNYHELVKETGKEEYIKIINEFVPNEDVGKYYHASDLVILPYRSATQSAVLNVAYSFLKPVIVTRVGGLAEFVINNMTGIIVEPDSPDAIVDGVDKFLSLRETTDFEGNIDKLNKSSEFEKLPALLDEIIKMS